MQPIDLRFTTVKQPLPDFIHAELGDFVRDSHDYHRQSDFLRERLAAKHNVPAEMIYLTAGADQAIFLLARKYGQQTHIFTPTYVGYQDVERFGYQLHEHYALAGNTYRIDTDPIPNASLIFLANPNNPAGLTARAQVLELVKNNPHAQVVIDEAYGDFSAESVADCVVANKNLIVIRSFSKSHALAGFRIGYLIAQPEVIENLFFETTWFNVSYPSIGAATIALDHEEYFRELRDQIIEQRILTEMTLKECGFTVIPGWINSLLIHTAGQTEATKFVDELTQHGFLVNQGNGGSNIGLNNSLIRISVGAPEHMQALRNAIKLVIGA